MVLFSISLLEIISNVIYLMPCLFSENGITESTPPPLVDHEYICCVCKEPVEPVNVGIPKCIPPKVMVDSGMQTDMTLDDLRGLEDAASPDPLQAAKETVDNVLDSDSRCNFYTGVESVDLLKGLYISPKYS